jgi:hypothetical protein
MTKEQASMSTEGDDKLDDRSAVDAALDEALEGLIDVDQLAGSEAVDYRWLVVGLKLGLERPERARTLLAMIAAKEHVRPDGAEEPASIPVASRLLARAAALSPSARTSAEPDAAFGWVATLASSEILQLGTVVGDMLDAGAPPDIAKGFGITWSAGVRVSRQELESMMADFTELEITVGGILAQRDLRIGSQAEPPQGIAAWLGDWMPRARPEESQAAAAIERNREPARRGLVALWNVWMALRHRARIPGPTFDLLVHPWVTVIGPLPD